MSSKTLGTGLAAAILLSALTLVGCSLTGPREKDQAAHPVVGGSEGPGAKRIILRMMIATRPVGDPGLSGALWSVADEQSLNPDTRRVLQANGFRFGVGTGELPKEVQEILAAPPPQKIDVQTIIIPESIATVLDPGTPLTQSLAIMLGHNDKVIGKVYESARGYLRVTGSFDGEDAVSLRIVPELHHGPVQKGWAVAPGATPMTPSQIITKDGQKEEAFRELASTLVLRPGQVAVLGGRHEKRGSLGDFLFGALEKDSDRPVERVIFLWAGRSDAAAIGTVPLPGLKPIEPTLDEKR